MAPRKKPPKKKPVAKKKDKKPKKEQDSRSKGSGDDSLYLDPREELVKKGIYYVTGLIDTDSLLDIQQDILLKHLDPQWKDDVQIIVNSCGGSVPETWALIDMLDWIRMDVRTIAMGDCASAGAALIACGTPGKRVCAPNTSIMVHGCSLFMCGRNDLPGLIDTTKMMKDEKEKDIRFWLKHSKYTTRKQVKDKLLNDRDNWFTAKEALAHGIVDHIIGETPEKPKGKK